MPAYSKNRWSCVFFIVYLSIELYFIMNLVQTVFHTYPPTVGSFHVTLLWFLFAPPAPGSGVRHVQRRREDEVQISPASQTLGHRPRLPAVGQPAGTAPPQAASGDPASDGLTAVHHRSVCSLTEAERGVAEAVRRPDALLQPAAVCQRPLPHVQSPEHVRGSDAEVTARQTHG